MENTRISVTRKYGDYRVYYTDNSLCAGCFDEKDELKGVSFKYINKTMMLINNDYKITKNNKTFKYGFIIGNYEFKMGLFSFKGDEIDESISVNYEDYITILNLDKKAVIEDDYVRFFNKDKELKKIKHNIIILHPNIIKNINDMKAIDPDNSEKKTFDKITYTKIMESEKSSLYINTKVTDKDSKTLESKNVTIRLMLVSGKEKMLFIISNFEKSKIECKDFIYVLGNNNISFFEDDLYGLILEFSYFNYLITDFKFVHGRIKMFDTSGMTVVSGEKVESYGYEDLYDTEKHIVNMASVTSNIELKKDENIDPEEELNKLIGLEAAKKQIRRFKNTCLKAMENGYPINLHMMFLGNPGTGKTTFARLVADIFYKYGILPTNKYVEGSRDTLVGMYQGETEEKTNAVFQSAMGGVLFIDEAYSLYVQGVPNDYGNIAMAELIKLMEDYRGKICVIFAGYTKEMHDLLRSNAGLKSRIQYEIQFDDYSKEELRQILDMNLKKENYEISDNDANLIIDFVDKKRGSLAFANAREVRTALEQITMIQAERTYKIDIDDRKLLKCDVDKYISENTYKKRNNKIPTYKMISEDYLKKCSEKVLDINKDYERIIESCIEIAVNDNTGLSYSSAFIISPDGYAITAGHSVKDATKITARRRVLDRLHNTVETYHNCYLCGADYESDIAIIKIENELDNKFPYLPLYTGKEYLPIFTKIIVFGYPLGINMYDNLSGFEGYISSVQNIKNNKNMYNLDVISMPGSSGACLIDKNTMKVIGIINGLKGSDKHGIPFGCPIQEIWKLVNGGDDNE